VRIRGEGGIHASAEQALRKAVTRATGCGNHGESDGNGANVTDRKQKLREETERLVQEALQRKGVTIEKLKTRIDHVCGKCGYRGYVLAPPNSSRVPFTCKECGHSETTL